MKANTHKQICWGCQIVFIDKYRVDPDGTKHGDLFCPSCRQTFDAVMQDTDDRDKAIAALPSY